MNNGIQYPNLNWLSFRLHFLFALYYLVGTTAVGWACAVFALADLIHSYRES